MIIPIRCFTCNKVIAHIYEEYENKVKEAYKNTKKQKYNNQIIDEINDNTEKHSVEGKILNELGIERQCCRRMFISQIDVFEKISKID